mmetsp:Transcript_36689/g.95016  ORF Transcript_36689/g.95016 Transcript_36689/m.95016 type:complete len:217 (-) Transcript_36689:21-671(-)
MVGNLLEGYVSGIVQIQVPEEAARVPHLLDVLHVGCSLGDTIDKGCCDYIQDGQQGEGHVEAKQHTQRGRDVHDEWVDQLVPIHAAGEAQKDRQQRLRKSSVKTHEFQGSSLVALLLLDEVHQDHLGERQACYVDDQREQNRGPKERSQGVHDTTDEHPQLLREAHDVQHAYHPHGAEEPRRTEQETGGEPAEARSEFVAPSDHPKRLFENLRANQ